MHFDVITAFPEMISEVLKWGVVGKALEKNIFSVQTINPRKFTKDVHKTIDDRPFGGGDGMVMLFEPLSQCCESIGSSLTSAKKIYLSPAGELLNEAKVIELSQESHVVLLSGRYGGVDQRLVHYYGFESLSVGNYVLSGGELPALAVIDSVVRKLPGVLGHEDSAKNDSFANDLHFEAPLFTRPRETKGGKVPEILFSGDHKKMRDYQKKIGQLLTLQNRSELFKEKWTAQETTELQRFIKMQDIGDLILSGLTTDFLEGFLNGH